MGKLFCWAAGRLMQFAQEYSQLAGQGYGGFGHRSHWWMHHVFWAKSSPADSLLSAARKIKLGKGFFLPTISGATFPQKHINFLDDLVK